MVAMDRGNSGGGAPCPGGATLGVLDPRRCCCEPAPKLSAHRRPTGFGSFVHGFPRPFGNRYRDQPAALLVAALLRDRDHGRAPGRRRGAPLRGFGNRRIGFGRSVRRPLRKPAWAAIEGHAFGLRPRSVALCACRVAFRKRPGSLPIDRNGGRRLSFAAGQSAKRLTRAHDSALFAECRSRRTFCRLLRYCSVSARPDARLPPAAWPYLTFLSPADHTKWWLSPKQPFTGGASISDSTVGPSNLRVWMLPWRSCVPDTAGRPL